MSNFVLRFSCAPLMTAMLLLAGLAAADGVVDIRPTGSSAHVISQPGSYRLVADVTMSVDASAISITTNDVSLDLNGHVITGFAGGSANGVNVTPGLLRTSVRNGTISGFGGVGVNLASTSVVQNITVSACGSHGIAVSSDSHITECTVVDCGDLGILGGVASIIQSCIVRGNNLNGFDLAGFGGGGIVASSYSLVSNCVVADHRAPDGIGFGIYADPNTIIRGCNVDDNRGPDAAYGIRASTTCTIMDCSINYTFSSGGQARAILAGSGARIIGNRCHQTLGASDSSAVEVLLDSVVSDNSCMLVQVSGSGNAYGIKASSDVRITDNHCSGVYEGVTGLGIAYGIYTLDRATIRGNSVVRNYGGGTDGHAYGIYAFSNTLIEGNNVSENDGVGSGEGAGIFTIFGGRLIGNSCASNSGGTPSTGWGIYVSGGACTVINNSTSSHSNNQGIHLAGAGSFAELNRCSEGFTIAPGSTQGSGANMNITY